MSQPRNSRRHARQQVRWTLVLCALAVLDALVVWAALAVAFDPRTGVEPLVSPSPADPKAYQAFTALCVLTWLGMFAATGLYRRHSLFGGYAEYENALKACTIGTVASIALSYAVWRDLEMLSRGALLLAWFLTSAFIMAERFVVRRAVSALRRRGWLAARALIVGANEQGTAIARQWITTPGSGMHVVGFVDDFKPLGTKVLDDLTVIGRPTALDALVRATNADEVIIVPSAIAWESFEEIIGLARESTGYTLWLSPGFYEILATGVAVTSRTFVPLFSIDRSRIVGTDAVLKALVDYGLGLALLIPALPLMGLIALGLRREGPALERNEAIGQSGAPFNMLRFRSGGGNGGFVPRLERLLYTTGLDKLPQLFNVLAGEMSLVGPRPRVLEAEEEPPDEAADAPAAYNLQAVKPGIVGPWIVTGHYNSPDETRDELYYVRNWTVWADFMILWNVVLSLIPFTPQARRGPIARTPLGGRPDRGPAAGMAARAERTVK